MGNSIEWIKIYTNIFENRKIKFILSNKKGDKFFKIWLQLLTLAGKINDRGNIYISQNISYSPDSLAAEFNEPAKVISEALKLFESLEMIRVSEDSITVAGWGEYQNVEGMERVREQNRLRKQKQRERDKEQEPCHVTVTGQSREITQQNKNKNKNIEEDIDITTTTPPTTNNSSLVGGGVGELEDFYRANLGDVSQYVHECISGTFEDFGYHATISAMQEAVKDKARSPLRYIDQVAKRIASGDDYKKSKNEFTGFGAIFEKLAKEGENDKQESCS